MFDRVQNAPCGHYCIDWCCAVRLEYCKSRAINDFHLFD